MTVLASIPSPTQSVWNLGPFPLRAYALCIIVGIVVAIAVALRRWRDRGGNADDVWDVAGWAIVLGIVGGRVYHVATDPEIYFGENGKGFVAALKIWDGGLGIWGAVAFGALGVWIGCRRHHIKFAAFADAVAPGVIFAQAIGRLGNWFNNELYGAPTGLPWGLQIHDLNGRDPSAVIGTYQPTFLYELLWNVAIGVALLLLDRRFRLGNGTVLGLYIMGYTLGRVWIELLRRDTANHILGLRLNVWTSIVVFLIGLTIFVKRGGFASQREATPYTAGRAPSETGDETRDETRDETTDETGDETAPATADGKVD